MKRSTEKMKKKRRRRIATRFEFFLFFHFFFWFFSLQNFTRFLLDFLEIPKIIVDFRFFAPKLPGRTVREVRPSLFFSLPFLFFCSFLGDFNCFRLKNSILIISKILLILLFCCCYLEK